MGGPEMAPKYTPTLGRAPAEPWRASTVLRVPEGPEMAPIPPHAPRRSHGAPRSRVTLTS